MVIRAVQPQRIWQGENPFRAELLHWHNSSCTQRFIAHIKAQQLSVLGEHCHSDYGCSFKAMTSNRFPEAAVIFSGCRAPLTPSPGLGAAAESSSTLHMLQELWRNHYILSTEQANKHNPARRSRNFSPETATSLQFTCKTCATTPGTANTAAG